MTRILGPSNIGYRQQFAGITPAWWRPSTSPGSAIRVTGNPRIVASYKSVTQHSDRVAPTNYCRMISRVVGLNSVDATNVGQTPSSNRYDYWSGKSLTNEVRASNLPYGTSIPNGKVGVPEWMVDRVVANALADMNGIEANILEDLGQLRGTGKLMLETYRTICLTYLAARAGRFSELRKHFARLGNTLPRKLGNGWLMYFYGIKPLMGTIEALARNDKPKTRTYTARSRCEISEPLRNWLGSSYIWMSTSSSVKVQTQCELRATLRLGSNQGERWRRLGITGDPTDLLVTAWALQPYSFVLDWLMPVEQFLRSLVWSPSLIYQGGYVGRRHFGDGVVTDYAPWSGYWPYHKVLPKFKVQVRFYQRVTYPYRVPTVGLNIRLTLNSNQIISAAALIATR